jgi:hypothetical protein
MVGLARQRGPTKRHFRAISLETGIGIHARSTIAATIAVAAVGYFSVKK